MSPFYRLKTSVALFLILNIPIESFMMYGFFCFYYKLVLQLLGMDFEQQQKIKQEIQCKKLWFIYKKHCNKVVCIFCDSVMY